MGILTQTTTPLLPLLTFPQAHPLLALALLPALLLLLRSLYRLSPLHPLHPVPGPLLPRLTSAWLLRQAFLGREASAVHALHAAYGPVVRTGPRTVDIADGEALALVYGGTGEHHRGSTEGSNLKPAYYANFDIDGFPSIFSATDPAHRAPRAKAVAPLFSTASLRAGRPAIEDAAGGFVRRLGREVARARARAQKAGAGAGAGAGGRLDVLQLCRGMAIDVVSGYLFGLKYGGCDEDVRGAESWKSRGKGGEMTEKPDVAVTNANATPSDLEAAENMNMSASGMVSAFLAVGRTWYLPPWAFRLYHRFGGLLGPLLGDVPDAGADASIAHVEAFIAEVVSRAEAAVTMSPDNKDKNKNDTNNINSTAKRSGPDTNTYASTYPARLLRARFSPAEARAQCLDVAFAGTDTTAANLATICYELARRPGVYARLRDEVCRAVDSSSSSSSSKDSNMVVDLDDQELQALPYLGGVVREGLRTSLANLTRIPRVVPAGAPPLRFGRYALPAGTEVSCTPLELHLNAAVYPEPRAFRPERWLPQDGNEQGPTDAMRRDLMAFGLGPRQCIARNLATAELFRAVAMVAAADALGGLRAVGEGVELVEWFNSDVKGGKIELQVVG